MWRDLLTSDSYKQLGKVHFREDIIRYLKLAIDKGNENELRKILKSGMVDWYYLCGTAVCPLINSARRGWKNVVKYLLEEGADVNTRLGHSGQTVLHEAARKGHYDVAKLLIARGANISVHENMIDTPLHVASIEGHTNVVKLLLDAGVDANRLGHGGRTALYEAAMKGHCDVAKLLIARGANINVQENMINMTPLHAASHYSHTNVVKLLLDAGADANVTNNFGRTPLYFALRNNNTEAIHLLRGHGGTT